MADKNGCAKRAAGKADISTLISGNSVDLSMQQLAVLPLAELSRFPLVGPWFSFANPAAPC
jgi:hypothetical protein